MAATATSKDGHIPLRPHALQCQQARSLGQKKGRKGLQRAGVNKQPFCKGRGRCR